MTRILGALRLGPAVVAVFYLALLPSQAGAADQRHLARIAMNRALDIQERERAVARITDQALLAEVAKSEPAEEFHELPKIPVCAIARLTDQRILARLLEDPEMAHPLRELLIDHISDQGVLCKAALGNASPSVRYLAVRKIKDQNVLLKVAREDKAYVRREAIARLSNIPALQDLLDGNTLEHDERLTAQLRVLLLDAEIVALYGDLVPWVNSGSQDAFYRVVDAITGEAITDLRALTDAGFPRTVRKYFMQVLLEDSRGMNVARFHEESRLPLRVSRPEDLPRTKPIPASRAIAGVLRELFKNLKKPQLQRLIDTHPDGVIRQAASDVLKESKNR